MCYSDGNETSCPGGFQNYVCGADDDLMKGDDDVRDKINTGVNIYNTVWLVILIIGTVGMVIAIILVLYIKNKNAKEEAVAAAKAAEVGVNPPVMNPAGAHVGGAMAPQSAVMVNGVMMAPMAPIAGVGLPPGWIRKVRLGDAVKDKGERIVGDGFGIITRHNYKCYDIPYWVNTLTGEVSETEPQWPGGAAPMQPQQAYPPAPMGGLPPPPQAYPVSSFPLPPGPSPPGPPVDGGVPPPPAPQPM